MEFLDTSFLQNDEIKLVLDKFYSGNLAINWVPAYSFYICDVKGYKMGKCDLRIGHISTDKEQKKYDYFLKELKKRHIDYEIK